MVFRPLDWHPQASYFYCLRRRRQGKIGLFSVLPGSKFKEYSGWFPGRKSTNNLTASLICENAFLPAAAQQHLFFLFCGLGMGPACATGNRVEGAGAALSVWHCLPPHRMHHGPTHLLAVGVALLLEVGVGPVGRPPHSRRRRRPQPALQVRVPQALALALAGRPGHLLALPRHQEAAILLLPRQRRVALEEGAVSLLDPGTRTGLAVAAVVAVVAAEFDCDTAKRLAESMTAAASFKRRVSTQIQTPRSRQNEPGAGRARPGRDSRSPNETTLRLPCHDLSCPIGRKSDSLIFSVVVFTAWKSSGRARPKT